MLYKYVYINDICIYIYLGQIHALAHGGSSAARAGQRVTGELLCTHNKGDWKSLPPATFRA